MGTCVRTLTGQGNSNAACSANSRSTSSSRTCQSLLAATRSDAASMLARHPRRSRPSETDGYMGVCVRECACDGAGEPRTAAVAFAKVEAVRDTAVFWAHKPRVHDRPSSMAVAATTITHVAAAGGGAGVAPQVLAHQLAREPWYVCARGPVSQVWHRASGVGFGDTLAPPMATSVSRAARVVMRTARGNSGWRPCPLTSSTARFCRHCGSHCHTFWGPGRRRQGPTSAPHVSTRRVRRCSAPRQAAHQHKGCCQWTARRPGGGAESAWRTRPCAALCAGTHSRSHQRQCPQWPSSVLRTHMTQTPRSAGRAYGHKARQTRAPHLRPPLVYVVGRILMALSTSVPPHQTRRQATLHVVVCARVCLPLSLSMCLRLVVRKPAYRFTRCSSRLRPMANQGMPW
jgi:hypothetical protein